MNEQPHNGICNYRGYSVSFEDGRTFIDPQDGSGALVEVRDKRHAINLIDAWLR